MGDEEEGWWDQVPHGTPAFQDRMLKREFLGVLYDTETLPPWPLDGRTLNLFRRPIGQSQEFFPGESKTWLHTNMVQSGQLPTPQSMTLLGFRMGMDQTRPYLDRLRVYCRAVVRINVMQRILWTGPMSIIPCGTMLETSEHLDKEFVFEDKELPPLMAFSDPDRCPVQIGANEFFCVEVSFPSACGLERGEPHFELGGPVPVSFYFYGRRSL